MELGALSLPPPGRAPPGMQVMWENGASFLYVDGTCRYWTVNPLDPWAGVRTGALSPDGEVGLLSSLHYDSWPAWSGDQIPSSGGVDTDLFVLLPGMTTAGMVRCYGGCSASPVPAELQGVARSFGDVVVDLWSRGDPVTGEVRMVVVREETPSPAPIPYLDWPLAVDPASISISESQAIGLTWGQGRAVDGADAETLRALRTAYRASTLPSLVPHIPVQDGLGGTYKVFLRDSLPYEDGSGLIRPR